MIAQWPLPVSEPVYLLRKVGDADGTEYRLHVSRFHCSPPPPFATQAQARTRLVAGRPPCRCSRRSAPGDGHVTGPSTGRVGCPQRREGRSPSSHTQLAGGGGGVRGTRKSAEVGLMQYPVEGGVWEVVGSVAINTYKFTNSCNAGSYVVFIYVLINLMRTFNVTHTYHGREDEEILRYFSFREQSLPLPDVGSNQTEGQLKTC